MDIAFLLWLQGIRESLPPVVEHLLVGVSDIAASSLLIFIPCIIFWCLDKRAGQFLMFTAGIGMVVNQFIKNTVCCYRPWIRDAAVHPASGALTHATGYSFPSGHTQMAVDIFGSLGWHYRKRWPWLCALCWLFVAVVAFTRNFLGVHTPQDVIVALVEGIAIIWATERLLAWVDGAPGRDLRLLIVGLVALAAFIAYVVLKPYPVDYDAQGKLLVDPIAMQVDCIKAAGVFLGMLVGWFMERRLVGFTVDFEELGIKGLIVRLAVGVVVVVAFYFGTKMLSAVIVDARWFELVKNALVIWAAAFLAPFIFTRIEKAL